MSILHNLVSIVLLILGHGHLTVQGSTSLESTEHPEATIKIDYRLPTDILPSHYIIKLVPNLNVDKFSFEGNSSINITVLVENKATVTLHAKNLVFDEEYTSLVDVNNQTLRPIIHSIDTVTDFLTIDFGTPIALGSYWLNLKYTGLLNNDSKGFFRTSYVNENGTEVWLAATYFAPTYARQAFPCFDEPAMKAKFEISIKHFDNYTAISNMPVRCKTKDKVDSEEIWTNFNVTPVMSTYLIAYVVSDLKNISSEDGKFSCWSQKNKIHNCRYALDIGQKELKALEEYLGSGHVIPKMDNIAIPSFGDNAMENWGLVTYSENYLLYEEGVTKTIEKQFIVVVISHEFAHQWLGNLVSPAWWDHTWLSEGFANYFQYFIADKVKPNWRLMDQMVVENLQLYSFMVTEFQSDRPINTKVYSPSEIVGIFDLITYYKSGIVIRMISHALSDNVFQTGLRQFIKEKEYGSATSNDLFNVLISVAKNFPKNVPLKDFLNTWMDQTGYPVIHVSRLSASPGHVLVNQTEFAYATDPITPNLWWIPINYATQSNPNFDETLPSHWLEPNRLQQEVSLELSDDQWFIFNKQQTGLYRVNYDMQNWKLIADYLNTPNYTKIHVLNRAQLLDDSFNFAQYGYIEDHIVFLNITRYLAQEDDYIAWVPAFRAFTNLNKKLLKTETHKLFKLYILKLIEKVENRVGYSEMPEDDHVTKLSRVNIVKWACKMGSMKCANATRRSLIEHVNGSKKISTDLQDIVLCEGIRTANMTIWNKTFDFYLEVKNEKDRTLILDALGCSLDPNIIKFYLAKVIDPDFKIRMDQDPSHQFDSHIQAVAKGTEAGGDIMLDFIIENFAALDNTYSRSYSRPLWYKTYIDTIVEHITTDSQIKKLKEIPIAYAKEVLNSRENIINDNNEMNGIWLTIWEPPIRSFLLTQNLVDDSSIKSDKILL